MPATLVPEQVADETGFVEFEVLDQAIAPELPVVESGGWLRHQARRILRNLGMLSLAPMGRNLVAAEEVAMRLKTDKGESVTIAIPESVLDDPAIDLWRWTAKRAKAAA